jgi:DNA-binding NarL/FixJ family response regulator
MLARARGVGMKILIADDHPLFRSGIRHVLLQLSAETEILEAEDNASAMAVLVAHADIALVLLDLAMPGMHGLKTLDAMTQQYPALPIVILSASESRIDMQRALDGGALGFIQKSATSAIMLSALRLVLAGGIYVPPALVQSIQTPVKASDERREALTPRQTDVLMQVIEGKSNKAIATQLGLTEATVKAHVTGIFKALRVNNRMQAAIAIGKVTQSKITQGKITQSV